MTTGVYTVRCHIYCVNAEFGATLITLCTVYSNACMFLFSRLNYASARDGMLPKFLASIHTRYKTPVPALLFHVCTSNVYVCVCMWHVCMYVYLCVHYHYSVCAWMRTQYRICFLYMYKICTCMHLYIYGHTNEPLLLYLVVRLALVKKHGSVCVCACMRACMRVCEAQENQARTTPWVTQ